MDSAHLAQRLLSQEARGLLTRIDRLTSFAVRIPMVPAAAVSNEAQDGIERFLETGKKTLRANVWAYLRWLETEGSDAEPSEMQHRFTMLRLGFNVILEQFEIFSTALTQRSEHGTGVWLAGLDAVALDALRVEGEYYEVPPVICYLDRGIGAAIRRARTRLPGGDPNPVAIIRVPRERMVGAGIGSSLIHEVGHQGAALLDVLPALRESLRGAARRDGPRRPLSPLWERWISEIVADFWSVGMLGIGSTTGLMSVVSLPRYFVFRAPTDDPHPTPWIRVKLSCAMGKALYPDAHWDALSELWGELYPVEHASAPQRTKLEALASEIPALVSLLVAQPIRRAGGRTLADVLPIRARQPAALRGVFRDWRGNLEAAANARPSLVFAAFGQARADGVITPEEESKTLATLLTDWALRTALETSANCAAPARHWATAVA
jgi:hypothetical protein